MFEEIIDDIYSEVQILVHKQYVTQLRKSRNLHKSSVYFFFQLFLGNIVDQRY